MDKLENKLGNRLKDLRIENRKTQEQVAKDLGSTKATIGRYEIGSREPKTDMLNALADYFDVTTDYLLGRTDEKRPKKERFQNVNSISAHRIGKIEKLSEEALDQLDDYIQYLEIKYKK